MSETTKRHHCLSAAEQAPLIGGPVPTYGINFVTIAFRLRSKLHVSRRVRTI